jgi:hypothetical protein
MVAPYNIGLTVGANIDPLRKDLRKATNILGGFGNSVTSVTGAASAGFSRLQGVVAVFASGALVTMIKNASDAAREITNMSKSAGIGTDEFQRLAYGARSVGVENNKFADIIKNVNERLGEVVSTGSGPLKDFFEQIAWKVNVTAESFKNLSGPQALQLYYDSLVKANVSQKEMTFYMEQISSDATSLIPLLKNGGKGFRDMGDEAQRVGEIINDIEFKTLEENAKSFSNMGAAVKALSTDLATLLNPEIKAMEDLIVRSSRGWGDLITKIREWRSEREKNTALEEQAGELIKASAENTKNLSNVSQAAAKSINNLLIRQNELRDAIIKKEQELFSAVREGNKERIPGLQKTLELMNQSSLENQRTIDFLRLQSAEAAKILELRTGITAQVQAQSVAEAAIVAPMLAPKRGDENEFQNFVKDPFEAADPAKTPAMDMFDMGDEDPFATQQELFQKHWEEMNRIAVAGAGGVAQEIASRWGNAAGSTAAAGKSMFESFSQSSRKMFEVNKAWGIADAIVSTAQGIAAGVKLGWPMGIPAVAWAVANGAAQISRIRATQFGAGGGAPTATSAAPQGQSAPGTNAQGGQAERGGTLRIEGFNPDSLYSGSTLQGMANALEEFWNDGGGKGRVIFAGSQK